ncbi:MAG: hydroxymethylbilane synthase [Syntrophaceae bacterium]
MASRREFRVGSRGSALALTQTKWVVDRIKEKHPGVSVEIVIIKTTGDKLPNAPLSEIGGKGVFVKEIEEALLRKDVDFAVHSLKDMPAEIPDGLHIPVVPLREDPRDVLVSRGGKRLDKLPKGARIGTGSLRRGCQLKHRFPQFEIVPIRGNLDTRIRKLETENLDAVVVALAGMNRMGMAEKITQIIPDDIVVPAIGQGALGLELRSDDAETAQLVSFLDDPETRIAVQAERAFLKCFGSGCQLPIAARATVNEDAVSIVAVVASLDGKKLIKDQAAAGLQHAESLGKRTAQRILAKGGKEILASVYGCK